MNYLILKLITLVHTLLVIFICVAPFLNMNYLLLLHAIIVPFIIIHWLLNDNTCALTVAERNLKKLVYGTVDEDECFTCKLIEPVYDFKKNNVKSSKIIYIVTISLWLVSLSVLWYKYKTGSIGNCLDLFTF